MPQYEYQCEKCPEHIELNRRISERDEPLSCQKCNGTLKRAITAPGGYYIKGDNSASRRPARAGCFGGKKK